MNETIHIILRTILVLVILFLVFKLLGKKQISEMNMFDYITGITIGSIVADISLDIEKNLLGGLISILIYCLISMLISYLSLKSIPLRNFFNGKETILMSSGHLIRKNMSQNKITINVLEREARLMGYFHLEELNTIILESNGKMSFEPKEKNKPLTKEDTHIPEQNKGLVYNLIIDGTIIKENLKPANITIKWLNHELKILGKNPEDILLLTIDSNKKINYYLK